MTTHLDNHPHAFLDESNNVINVSLFDDHNSYLLEDVKSHLSATQVVCCCDYGIAYKPGDFYNGKFYPEKPYPSWTRNEDKGQWQAPVLYPEDGKFYTWDEDSLSWKENAIVSE